MKKLIAIIAVVALAAPLYGATVDITALDAASGRLQIGMRAGPGDPNTPIGISFRVSLSDGANIGPNPDPDVDDAYPVYIDAAHTIGSTYTFEPKTGSPLADIDGPGLADPNSSDFSVVVGRLDDPADRAAGFDNAELVTIQLFAGTSDTTTVTITADALRGTIIGLGSAVVLDVSYPAPFTIFLPDFVSTDCFPASPSDVFDRWVAAGKPDCWCIPCQAAGDINDDGVITGGDVTIMIPAFGKAIGDAGYNACADLNRDGVVTGGDVTLMIPSFGKTCAELFP